MGIALVLPMLPAVLGGVATAQATTPAPIEQVVDEWMPLPVLVVPEVGAIRASWKRNAGWARHPLRVEHRVDGEALEIHLEDGDGYCGAPVTLRLARDVSGTIIAAAQGRSYSCVSRSTFVDLHGGVRLEARSATSDAPLRFSFRIDAIEGDLMNPLRTWGAVTLDLPPDAWPGELRPTPVTALAAPPELRELRWLRPDGSLRARGHVDALGRRHGTWETWTPAGVPESVTAFERGHRHGPWTSHHPEGWTTTGLVEHGVPVGEWADTAPDGTRSVR